MQNNIFENAKFGDIFVSKDGTKHTFCSFTNSGDDTLARLYREQWGVVLSYLDGTIHSDNADFNIVERYEESSNEETDYLKLFSTLPHLDGEYNPVDDWGYTPSLYHFDTQWFVDWIHCSEGDSLLSYSGKTPEEAIMKAHTILKTLIKK